jgi:DNA-binding NarL/FixJ family response regulator
MHEETMITLLLVDDDTLVRQGLRFWLERAPARTVIGEASNGTEAITLAQAVQPDVVLMDITMPTMDGLNATAALRALAPHAAVILVSLDDDATMRTRAHAAGAAALVGKQEGPRVLLDVINEVGRRGGSSPPFE